MSSFEKTYLDALAKENGFIRDNLEKVMRLSEILRYFHENAILSQALVLKGGTAINLTVFDMPRLSVDIDLDFAKNCTREEMLVERDLVNKEIMAYMTNEGYLLKPSSKSPHSLDSWVFSYVNAGGNSDVIKVEINYSARCHVLPVVERQVNFSFLGEVKVNVLSPMELFASKINALIGRAAVRDLYDIHNMLKANLFPNEDERILLRKILVFYLSVGSTSKAEEVSLDLKSFPHIENLKYAQVRAQLIPVLSRHEKFDYLLVKDEILNFLNVFLQFSSDEYRYIELFNQREYHPEILFGSGEIANRISDHPMALWKCRPRDEK